MLALAGAVAISSGCSASEAPFQVSLQTVQDVPVIQLESVTDKVVLTGFTVNRGNCTRTKVGGIYPLPLTFKFGDGVKLFAYLCKVKEVALTTDQGTFTYSFR
ncbi:hypothetical protein BJP62_01645 [Jeongeupia sp. USM3]|nr:hypothetical protein BJP62_01645 [Jeongeupia sp. USM3]